MKKVSKYILSIIGLTSVLLFCVSATAGIGEEPTFVNQSISEPFNMLLLGFGLIGFGSFIKRRTVRQ